MKSILKQHQTCAGQIEDRMNAAEQHQCTTTLAAYSSNNLTLDSVPPVVVSSALLDQFVSLVLNAWKETDVILFTVSSTQASEQSEV